MDNNLLTEVCVSRIRQNVPELKALALSRKGLRDLDCCYIAQALKTNVFLQKLDLSDNALTDESALFLADMLLQNTALTHLDISGNPMTSAGGGAFIKALQTNASLVRLGCEGGMLGPAAEERILYWLELNMRPPDLKQFLPAVQRNAADVDILDLSGPNTQALVYDDAAAMMVADAMEVNTHVRTLILDHNFKTDSRVIPVLQALERNSTITSIGLRNDHVGPDGARALAQLLQQNDTLTEVNLMDNEIGDAGARALLEALEHNNLCRSLPLAGNDINDVLLRKIDAALTLNTQPNELKQVLPMIMANDASLLELRLCGASSGTVGNTVTKRPEDLKSYYNNLSALLLADALRSNTFVRVLDLRDNFIGPEGAKALAELLQINDFLATVNLKDNFVRDEGARALVIALERNDSVVELDLSGNGLSSKMETELKNAITLNRVPTKLKKLLPRLRANDETLTEISFADQALACVPPAPPKLQNLDDLCAELLFQVLQANTNLTTLNLSFQDFTDRGVRFLAGILHVNQALTSLNLYQNQAITDVGIDALIAALNANDVLTELDCSGANKVTLPALKALEAAVLMNRYPLALKRAIPLIRANAPTLRRLDLRPPVEDTPRAKRATLDDSACAVLASALRSNVYITALDLSGCGITSYGVQHIADYLRECAVLHSLDLSDNCITQDGAQFLTKALHKNATLQELRLRGNGLEEHGGKQLEALLRVNGTLRVLDTGGCGIHAKLQRRITLLIEMNAHAALVKNALVDALDNVATTDSIDFSCLATTHQFAVRKGQAPPSEVTDELVALAAQALHGNRYVTFLDLSYGTASVKGCHALTQILDHKSVLETIRLRHNCINDEGARALVDAAHRAPALTTLDIEGNDLVSDAMRRRIALAVALNTQPNAVKTAVLKIRQGDNSAKMLRLCVPDGGRYCDDTTCEILEHYYRETGMAVQRLDLSNNVITDVGVRYLARLVEAQRDLTVLKLSNNQITDEGVAVLIQAVGAVASKLESLQLDGNDIADESRIKVLDRKLKDSSGRTKAMPQPEVPRKGSPVLNIVEELESMMQADDLILRDALADRTTVLSIRSR